MTGDNLLLPLVAHELKTPLVLIRQLASELEAVQDEDVQQLAAQIFFTAQKTLRITSDMTRAYGERAEEQMLPFSLHKTCDDVVFTLQPLFAAHGTRVQRCYSRGAPLVYGSPFLLGRVLSNFLDNALLYAPDTNVVRVSSTYRRTQDVMRIAVRDFGPQIPLAVWRRIKGDSESRVTTSSRPLSSGLGILMSLQFSEMMGASMGVIRHRDGTSFFIDLPLSKQQQLL